MTPEPSVTSALARVMAELPAIGKDLQAAPQQGGYAYRGIEAVTKHVQPLFAKHGIVVAPHVQQWEVDHIEVNGKPWTDTRCLISYTVYGPGGIDDRIEVGPFLTVGRDNADKGGNKCATQGFKYLLLQLLCVSDSKDDADGSSIEADQRRPATAQIPWGYVAALDAKKRLVTACGQNKELAALIWADRGSGPIAETELEELEAAARDGAPFEGANT